jgi:WD40 repeat protein
VGCFSTQVSLVLAVWISHNDKRRLNKEPPLPINARHRYLAVEDATEGIDLFDSKSGTRIARLASSWGFKNVTFSQDESLLAASDAAQFVVYDLKRKKARKIDVTSVDSLALSSKGNFLWAASYYAAPQVLTTEGKRISRKFPEEFSSRYEHSVFGSFMDSDSKVVMKTALGDVGVWDWKSNKVIELPAKAERLSVAEAGLLTITEGGVAELWDRNLKKVFTFEGLMNRAIMTFDGTRVVTVTRDGTLTLWEVRI